MGRFIDYMATKIGLRDAIWAVVVAGGIPYAHSWDRLDEALETPLSATNAIGSTRTEVDADYVLLSLSGSVMAAGAPRTARAG